VRKSASTLCLLLAALAAACGESGNAPTPATPGTGISWPADERFQVLRTNLHVAGSGDEARRLYPDLIQVFVDEAQGKQHPTSILPFRYYWSPSGQFTVSICAVQKTVFLCPYYLASRITPVDFNRCQVDETYVRFELATPPH
jgi:hypothetical protein